MRHLIVLLATVLFAWLLYGVTEPRLQWLQGPTVVGTINNTADHEGTRSLSIDYVASADSGSFACAVMTFTTEARLPDDQFRPGSEVQLKLWPTDPSYAVAYSVNTLWREPVAVLLLGSSVLLVLVWVVAPPPGHRFLDRKRLCGLPGARMFRASRRTTVRIAALLVLIAAVALIAPRVLHLPAAVLLLLIGLALTLKAVLNLLQNLGRSLRPAMNQETNHHGLSGQLVELIRHTACALIGLCFLLSGATSLYSALDHFAPTIAWSSNRLNSMRSMLWLPQDYDVALCQAVERADRKAAKWLVHNGARANTICAAGNPPVTAALLLPEHPGTRISNIVREQQECENVLRERLPVPG